MEPSLRVSDGLVLQSPFLILHSTIRFSDRLSAPRGLGEAPSLLVTGAKRREPVAVAIADHLDLPRLAADGTVLNEILARTATLVDVELHGLATVGTLQRNRIDHRSQLNE